MTEEAKERKRQRDRDYYQKNREKKLAYFKEYSKLKKEVLKQKRDEKYDPAERHQMYLLKKTYSKTYYIYDKFGEVVFTGKGKECIEFLDAELDEFNNAVETGCMIWDYTVDEVEEYNTVQRREKKLGWNNLSAFFPKSDSCVLLKLINDVAIGKVKDNCLKYASLTTNGEVKKENCSSFGYIHWKYIERDIEKLTKSPC